jgi:vancomycin permeability regulator SanA
LTAAREKSLVWNNITIMLILTIEALIFLFLSAYKYHINYPSDGFFSLQFLKIFFTNYDLLYIGNLSIFISLIITIIACIRILMKAERVSTGTLRILLVLEILTILLLIISVLTSKETFDEVAGRIVEFDERGGKILSLSIFIGLKIFCTVSLLIVAFNVLSRFYVFRALWFSLIVAVLLIIVVFFSVNNHSDDTKMISNTGEFDAGVILGAAVWGGNRPSPILRERINKGYELFRDKKIKKIVLTGGGSKGEKTEAEVAGEELIKKGISIDNIIIENQSNSTLQQISYISKKLYKPNKWKNLVFISDNFHLFRTEQICSFFDIKCYTAASETPLSAESGLNFSLKETFAVIVFWLFGIG